MRSRILAVWRLRANRNRLGTRDVWPRISSLGQTCFSADDLPDVSSPQTKNISLYQKRKSVYRYAIPRLSMRDVSRSSRHAARGAMDADGLHDEQGRLADGKGVWSRPPRRWGQVRGKHSRTTEAIKPALRGDHAISRKPSRRECRLFRLNLWSLPPAFFTAGGPWVRLASGIPCALRF